MAVYSTVNTVQCNDQAEYDLLVAHLQRKGIVEGQPPPEPWDRSTFDVARLRVTLGRRDVVSAAEWA